MGPSMDALANTAIIGKPSNGEGGGGELPVYRNIFFQVTSLHTQNEFKNC